jgi:hypothetical protein
MKRHDKAKQEEDKDTQGTKHEHKRKTLSYMTLSYHCAFDFWCYSLWLLLFVVYEDTIDGGPSLLVATPVLLCRGRCRCPCLRLCPYLYLYLVLALALAFAFLFVPQAKLSWLFCTCLILSYVFLVLAFVLLFLPSFFLPRLALPYLV